MHPQETGREADLSEKMEMLPVEALPEHRSWAILARNFCEDTLAWDKERQKTPKAKEERCPAVTPAASLRSEQVEMKSAVEMTPRGKRGKLQKPKRVSHSFHRAWKSGQKQRRRISHISTAPAAGYISLSGKGKREDGAGIEFRLTDPRHLKHDKNVSVAPLRS